jgi:hypothetical protein
LLKLIKFKWKIETILTSKIKMEVKVTSWLYYDISRECSLLCYIRNLCETLERKTEAPDPHAAIRLSR